MSDQKTRPKRGAKTPTRPKHATHANTNSSDPIPNSVSIHGHARPSSHNVHFNMHHNTKYTIPMRSAALEPSSNNAVEEITSELGDSMRHLFAPLNVHQLIDLNLTLENIRGLFKSNPRVYAKRKKAMDFVDVFQTLVNQDLSSRMTTSMAASMPASMATHIPGTPRHMAAPHQKLSTVE